MNFLEEFVRASHVALEERPPSYGVFHLTFVAMSLIIIAAACFFLRKSSDKTFRCVMFSVGSILILSEIYKQLYYLYADGSSGYDWYIFPFQLCSVPMYLSVAVGCMKKSRTRDMLCKYLASIGFLGGIMAYIEPSGILKTHYFTLIHSCVWHALLIFIALYIIVTKNACQNIKSYRNALITFGGVILTATALNIIFRAKTDFNMCYISPFYKTPLAVFSSFDSFFMENLGALFGRIISILIYIFAVSLGGAIVYYSSYLISKSAKSKRI